VLILALDTSTSAIGVAVLAPGSDPVVGVVVEARAHTERLAPLLRDTLAAAGATPADLTDIAVGTGPGPFTGLRVGLVTAVTMGLALGVPVHGVCSLDALAEQALAEAPADGVDEVLVATDARRKEVYWARYAPRAVGADGAVSLGAPAVDRPAEVPDDVRSLPTVGRGPVLFPDLFPHPLGGPLDVDPGWLGRVAARRMASGVAMPVEPLYLRRPDALTTAERVAGQ
jgi:tRNA threonylcarbamoyladenosine biosynthesis protein TsaB